MEYLEKLEAHLVKPRHKGQLKEARRLVVEAVLEYTAEQNARTWRKRLRRWFRASSSTP